MMRASPIVLFTGIQRMARELRQRGFSAACLREPDEAVPSPDDVDIWIPYDARDLQALETWARNWPLGERVVAVINRRERRVMEHAILNEAFRRPGIRRDQAAILRDKLLMRRLLSRTAPHLNPPFQEALLTDQESPSIPPPFLIKPRNLFKSQLISLCERPERWESVRRNLLASREVTGERHGVAVGESFVAESYLVGPELSVDALIGPQGEALFTPPVRLTPARHRGMEDFHVAVRRIPSEFSQSEANAILAATNDLVQALDLQSTPLHVDMVIHNGVPRVLDVASRVGGYRSEMMALAHGAPLDPLTLDLARGKGVRWEPRWNRAVAVVELFPPGRGRIKTIQGLEEIRRLRSFRRLRQRMEPGAEVGWAKDGFRCPLFVVLAHQDSRVVVDDVAALFNTVIIELNH
jgi:hypothetical protein